MTAMTVRIFLHKREKLKMGADGFLGAGNSEKKPPAGTPFTFEHHAHHRPLNITPTTDLRTSRLPQSFEHHDFNMRVALIADRRFAPRWRYAANDYFHRMRTFKHTWRG